MLIPTNIIVYVILIGVGLMATSVLLLCVYTLHAVLVERRADRIPTLLYHRLISRQDTPQDSRSKLDRSYVTYDTAFAEQMDYLDRERYTTISLDDLIAYQDGRISLPGKPIMITFDDGFASNYHHAFPILKKHRMKATIFVTPDVESENFKKNALTDSPLTIPQLQEMSEQGISIQSHAMTHRYLTELDQDTVRWELLESKRFLEERVGKKVLYLAIPSGAYNRTVRTLAKETGYKAVFCMLKGSNNRHSDRYALRRLVIGREFSMDEFCRILSPGTAAYLRVESFLQNALFLLLGPAGLDKLRDFLYGSRVGSFLGAGKIKYLIPGFAILLAIIIGTLFLVV